MLTCPETVGIPSSSCCDPSQAGQPKEAPACRPLPACCHCCINTRCLLAIEPFGHFATLHSISGGAGMPPRPYGTPPMGGMPMHAGHPGGPGSYGPAPGAMGGMPPQGGAN